MVLSRQMAIEAFNEENAVEETQSISCLLCGQLWNIPKGSAEEDDFINISAEDKSKGIALGWFQGRMEFGPRALGNRSILGDPRNPEMQKKMNLRI